jgi:beta-exotoxin I transport system ATP-binding protein
LSATARQQVAKSKAASSFGSHPLIATEGLSKRFSRIRAVSDLTLDVGEGEIVGFLGPNGAGKTTTIRMLMGFINPSAGRCTVLGGSLRTQHELRRRVGYLPGDFRMDPAMTGRDLFVWFGRLRGGVDHRRVDELVEGLQLDPTRPFGALSKGNRQKIGIVQALMHDPDVLILDEPTTGLDPLIQRQFLGLVGDAAQRGAAVLFSSHVLPEVERLATRVAIIRAGRLVTSSTVDELLDHSRHRLELRFAEAVPRGLFRDVPGVVDEEVDGKTVVITLEGPMAPAMRVVASQPGLLRVGSASDDLEDLFIKLYDSGGDGPNA